MLPWLPADTTATDAISTMMSGMKTQNDGLPAEEDTILYEAAFKMICTDKYVYSNRNNLYKATLYRQIYWVTNTLHLQELPCYRNQAVKLLHARGRRPQKDQKNLKYSFYYGGLWKLMLMLMLTEVWTSAVTESTEHYSCLCTLPSLCLILYTCDWNTWIQRLRGVHQHLCIESIFKEKN